MAVELDRINVNDDNEPYYGLLNNVLTLTDTNHFYFTYNFFCFLPQFWKSKLDSLLIFCGLLIVQLLYHIVNNFYHTIVCGNNYNGMVSKHAILSY